MSDGSVTEDLIYGGQLRIRQPARGYRVNVDTILIGASAPQDAVRVAEAGCGVGGALLVAALGGAAGAQFVGIERNAAMAALARANVAANGLTGRVEIVVGDALLDSPATFDAVFFNPPFDAPGDGRVPDESRREAHVTDRPLADWIKVWSNRLSSGGSLTLIQRAQRLPDILEALEGRLGGATVYPVRPFAGAAATRIIVRAYKGSRAPFALLAGLDLHPDQGEAKHTPEAEAILRGAARIAFA